MPDIKGAITRPVGPLPAYAWVLVVVGGYFAYKFISGRSGSSTSSTGTVEAGTSAGSGDALSTSVALADLTQAIKDLKNTTPATPVTPTPTNSLGAIPSNPIKKITPPVWNDILPKEVPAKVPTVKGVQKTMQSIPIYDANTHTLMAPQSFPAFNNNSAVPRPVGLPTYDANTHTVDGVPVPVGPGLPTFSDAHIPTKSLSIPATTPHQTPAEHVAQLQANVKAKRPKTPVTVQQAVESGMSTSGYHYDANTHTLVPN